MLALFVVLIAVSLAQGNKKPTPSSSGTAKPPAATSSSVRAAADTRAQAAIARALRVLASDYQVWGNYAITSPFTLGNEDHALRAVHGLKASGNGKTFVVSVPSTSGTTFTVSGNRLHLERNCTPAGPGCPAGHWPGSSVLALPKVPVVSAAEKNKIDAILTGSVNHYALLVALGKQALGTTQYANANAGLAAFADPNSAASRFRDYRAKSNAERDLFYLKAFQRADSYYTAANEPAAISTWRDDMTQMTGDLIQWVNVAVDWQIRNASTAKLQAAAARVDADLAKAKRDIAAVLAGR